MSLETSDLGADLAWLRRVAEGGAGFPRTFGQIYFAAGAIYLAQVLLAGAVAAGALPSGPLTNLAVGLGPTAVFFVVLALVLRRAPKGATAGLPARALGAFFGSLGLANVALAGVIGLAALRARSVEVWLIYPCAVYVLQGAGWLAAASLLRRPWMYAVVAAWLASAGVMAAFAGWAPGYVAAAAAGLALGMAAPGLYMMRQPPGA